MAKGFCPGCPTPENLAEYRAGRLGGGYFSDPLVLEVACRLVEAVANRDECAGKPEIDDIDEKGDERVVMCDHPERWTMAQIGDAMETNGESPAVIIRIESNEGNN